MFLLDIKFQTHIKFNNSNRGMVFYKSLYRVIVFVAHVWANAMLLSMSHDQLAVWSIYNRAPISIKYQYRLTSISLEQTRYVNC